MRRSLLLIAFLSAWLGGIHASAQTHWTAPRLANGQPDLQGSWENNSATPLERPAQLKDKPRLTDAELADMERRAKALF